MTVSEGLIQDPSPGTHRLRFRGDCQTFTLTIDRPRSGGAWLRTNLGSGARRREGILRQVDRREARRGEDWADIPMPAAGPGAFRLTLPLTEVGHFEAKSFFLEDGTSEPVWPPGPNVTVNVEPAHTCCANIIYNAFVRQFGPNKAGGGFALLEKVPAAELDAAGYTLIPPSGTFRDLIHELDFIFGHLGCRILQLLPIHPTPTTYGRMGRFGSPFAALSFTEVDPALAEFDPRATPVEQFVELVDAVHARQGRVIIDIAINHTGWAARLHEAHPEWLVRDADGRIEVPGAWGVRWEDLTRLDYRHTALWHHMADVFLTWCRRGVDGFRCDAGYMIPEPAWEYMVARVREQYPDTVFLLEGLGGKVSVTRRLLDNANLNWAYSELFQNYDRDQVSAYLPRAVEISRGQGLMVHFAETHDNNRLAARSAVWARMRTALCALGSMSGAFGFANGVEWLATEKIDVHDAPSLNWGAAENQVDHIRRLNTLLHHHPCFFDGCWPRIIGRGTDNCLVFVRHHRPSGKRLLVAVNLTDEREAVAAWQEQEGGLRAPPFFDLLSGRKVYPDREGDLLRVGLAPGEVLCLTADRRDLALALPSPAGAQGRGLPARTRGQLLQAKALDVFRAFCGTVDIGDFDPAAAGRRLAQDPERFCRSMNPNSDESRVVPWDWPVDTRRKVMVPPGHFLLVRCPHPFRATVVSGRRTLSCESGLRTEDSGYFALFSSLAVPRKPRSAVLKMTVYRNGGAMHRECPLLLLPEARRVSISPAYRRAELLDHGPLLLATNGRGAMSRAAVLWGRLYSRYDALLAANLNPDCPDDRRILFTRCRAWLRYQGFSAEIGEDCLHAFCYDEHGGRWHFRAPMGQGQHVRLELCVQMVPGENETRLTFTRLPGGNCPEMLDDHRPVRLILRPDIEDRSFHAVTKAHTGPEFTWPEAVTPRESGFRFQPDPGRCLELELPGGKYYPEPEWHYMVHRPQEAQRGQDPDSDLFSPGYFDIFLTGGRAARLTARAHAAAQQTGAAVDWDRSTSLPARQRRRQPVSWAENFLQTYVAERTGGKTVVAGYPWFLDWGRDALIFVRGLVAAGMTGEARAVLVQFGRFEENGTLPNMIQGNAPANRDTSDAALWFVIACADLVRRQKSRRFLGADCGSRSVHEVLVSIAENYLAGTPNGIAVDPDSGLVFSPVHFTWMDTNYPAGTPRQGYPVEIQALWIAALNFLAGIDRRASHWKALASRARRALVERFFLAEQGYLADCLSAEAGQPARQATPDDALRPNQLLAVTLGAVRDPKVCRAVVDACRQLVVPGAIRSLADRPVQHPLEIWHQGRLLNDPHHPYQGAYTGDEDTRRKPAYHNGTAWTWPFPVFCEAWLKAYGPTAVGTVRAWLSSSLRLMRRGCAGHIPEIMDGDFPHTPRGCDAQAWGLSEFVRVWKEVE